MADDQVGLGVLVGQISVVVGGQYGSEGKGSITGIITQAEVARAKATRRRAPVCVRVGGPNAGHTVMDSIGREWKLRQIPVGAVVDTECTLVIAPRSEIDPPVLRHEIASLDEAGYHVSSRLLVDYMATVIEDRHKQVEQGMFERIGSTAKGIGAARADRVMRTATIWRDYKEDDLGGGQNTEWYLRESLRAGRSVVIEAAQGFALGLHCGGHYPYCTSADGRALDALGDTGLSPWAPYVEGLAVWVVLRTYPIRVAGNSGPMEREITWDDLYNRTRGYVKPERTTVTDRIRRIGEWDPELASRAVAANGERVQVALTMLDYVNPDVSGVRQWSQLVEAWPEVVRYLAHREEEIGAPVRLLGTGKSSYVWRP